MNRFYGWHGYSDGWHEKHEHAVVLVIQIKADDKIWQIIKNDVMFFMQILGNNHEWQSPGFKTEQLKVRWKLA